MKPIRPPGPVVLSPADVLLAVELVDRALVVDVATPSIVSVSRVGGCGGSVAASRLGAFGPLGAGHGLS